MPLTDLGAWSTAFPHVAGTWQEDLIRSVLVGTFWMLCGKRDTHVKSDWEFDGLVFTELVNCQCCAFLYLVCLFFTYINTHMHTYSFFFWLLFLKLQLPLYTFQDSIPLSLPVILGSPGNRKLCEVSEGFHEAKWWWLKPGHMLVQRVPVCFLWQTE